MANFKTLLAFSMLSSLTADLTGIDVVASTGMKVVQGWKRKKCKSCTTFKNKLSQCPKDPNSQACSSYSSRKK